MPVCPVCGFPGLQEPPRAPSGGGSYEICPCCGFQFGVDDDDRGITDQEARERWVAKGKPWYSKSRPAPKGWDAEVQLQALLASKAKAKVGSKKKPVSKKKSAPTVKKAVKKSALDQGEHNKP